MTRMLALPLNPDKPNCAARRDADNAALLKNQAFRLVI